MQGKDTAESSQQQDVQPPAKRQRGAAEPAGPDGGGGGGSEEPTRLVLSLSEPLLLRVLSFLPPDDLLALSQTCRHLRAAASDGAIWRRLYHSRCISPLGHSLLDPPVNTTSRAMSHVKTEPACQPSSFGSPPGYQPLSRPPGPS